MSIFVNKETKLLVQGIKRKEGQFHTRACVDYGTQVVAGVTPGNINAYDGEYNVDEYYVPYVDATSPPWPTDSVLAWNNTWENFFDESKTPSYFLAWYVYCVVPITRESEIVNYAKFSAVPIPATIWLIGSGLIGLIGIRRKLKK